MLERLAARVEKLKHVTGILANAAETYGELVDYNDAGYKIILQKGDEQIEYKLKLPDLS